MALSDGSAIEVVWEQGGARIVCAESMGHGDERLTSNDVMVAGSHCAVCAVELLLHLRLRGVIGHAAGPGLDNGGISGLARLAEAGVPAAAVMTSSAPIADGITMYEEGIIGYMNDLAREVGVEVGMRCKDAARLMAIRRPGPAQIKKKQYVVYDGPEGKVVALDTIGHGDERINGTVICMGSHSGSSMADYVKNYELLGSVTNDAGQPPSRSAVRGLEQLAERGIPAAVVHNDSARVGDGRSTWCTGILSDVNAVAAQLGISVGMPASEAALVMLAAATRSAS